jgi:hypothetical protein
MQIVSNVLYASHAKQPDNSRPFSPAVSGTSFSYTTGATAKTYACFKLYVPCTPAMTVTTYSYFAHFKDALITGTTFTGKLYTAGITGDPTHFNLAINNTVTAGPYAPWATPLSCGTWYVIAMMYDAQTGISKFWVNPLSESSTSVSATDPAIPGRLLAAFALRQVSTAGSGDYTIDDISVGPTFDETCASMPTPTSGQTWGQLKSIYR